MPPKPHIALTMPIEVRRSKEAPIAVVHKQDSAFLGIEEQAHATAADGNVLGTAALAGFGAAFRLAAEDLATEEAQAGVLEGAACFGAFVAQDDGVEDVVGAG